MPRTTDLMVNIYGNDKSASKAIKEVAKEADKAREHFKKFGKDLATGFAVVGGAAVAIAVQSVKNALEDEKSQRRLAIALKNTVNATKEQTASVEDYINKTQARYGVVDDELRPSLQRLVTATKDITEAQKLQTLALDISKGTGKDLATVSNALGKAYGGNLTSLQRLGVGLDASVIKSKDTKKAFEILSKTFGGQAAGAADSLEGRFGRLKIALDEAKEQIGYALMPVMEDMATYLVETVVPNVMAFVDGLTGVDKKGGNAYESVRKWGQEVRSILKWVGENKKVLVEMAAAMAMFWAVGKIAGATSAMINAFKAIRTQMAITRGVAVSTAAAEAAASGGTMIAIQALAAGAVFAAFGLSDMWGGMSMPSAGEADAKTYKELKAGDPSVDFTGSMVTTTGAGAQGGRTVDAFTGNQKTKFYNGLVYTYDPAKKKYYVPDISGGRDYSVQPRAMGGAVARGASYLVGERGPELLTMGASNGFVTPNNRLGGLGGTTVVVNVAGSVIHEKDLAVTVRDNIAQLMRRRGLNPAILGV